MGWFRDARGVGVVLLCVAPYVLGTKRWRGASGWSKWTRTFGWCTRSDSPLRRPPGRNQPPTEPGGMARRRRTMVWRDERRWRWR